MDSEQPQQDSAPVEESDATAVPLDSEHTTDNTAGEAAKYRHRLRDTEAQLDTMTARVEAMQRGEVERLAAAKLADPADVWRDGATLDTLCGDDGNIDPAKVDELLGGLVQSHSHWARKQSTLPSGGLRSGATKPADYQPTSWASALRPTD